MPPAKRIEQKPAEEANSMRQEPFLRVGQIVNLVAGGRTLPGYEVLGWDGEFIKFRGSVHVAPQTEVVLIPYGKIEAIGLTDER